jgi:hypothetical protein
VRQRDSQVAPLQGFALLAPITVAVSISVAAESTTPLRLPVLRSLRAGDRIMLIGYMIPLRPYAFRHWSLRFSDHRPGVLFTKLPSSHGLGPATKPAQQPVPTAPAGFRRRVGAPRVWFPLAHEAPSLVSPWVPLQGLTPSGFGYLSRRRTLTLPSLCAPSALPAYSSQQRLWVFGLQRFAPA